VWDPGSERVLLFGGTEKGEQKAGFFAWDGTSWEEVAATGSKPGKRVFPAMVQDESRGVVVLAGGYANELGVLGDVWEWDGTKWRKEVPDEDALLPRLAAGAAWDDRNGVAAFFGGATDAGYGPSRDGLWLWDGENGLDAGPPGEPPSERVFFAATWDPDMERVLVEGGCRLYATGSDVTKHETWSFDGWRWELVTEASPLECASQAAWHEASGTWISAGGAVIDGSTGQIQFADKVTWSWSKGLWTELGPAPDGIAERAFGGAADSAGGDLFVFGGFEVTDGLADDLWAFDGVGWSEVPFLGEGPAGRRDPLVAWDRVSGELVVAGGEPAGWSDPEPYLVDTWTFDGSTWTVRGALAPPLGIIDPQAGWHDHLQAIVSIGGLLADDSGLDMTPRVFERAAGVWVPLAPMLPPAPIPRYRGEWAWDHRWDRGLLLGGLSVAGQPLEVWELRAGGAMTPAVQLDVRLEGQPFSPGDVESVRVRTRCGGRHAPFGPDDAGASLLGWSNGAAGAGGVPGGALGDEGWRLLSEVPAPAVAPEPLETTVTDPAALAALLLEGGDRLSFQVRPKGPAGAFVPGLSAEVTCDRFEVRVRYLATP
jgi:hypothetical protein